MSRKEEDDLRRRSLEGEMYDSVKAQYQRHDIFQSLREEKGLADGAWYRQLFRWPYGCDFHYEAGFSTRSSPEHAPGIATSEMGSQLVLSSSFVASLQELQRNATF